MDSKHKTQNTEYKTKKTLQALLVDDEASAHENLTELLMRFCPEVDVVGNATHVDQAISLIGSIKPNLVFLDIEMPRKSGFELIDAFTSVDFHIIFVTAYNQYALKAFEVSAIDYLLKPVEVDRLKDAVHKVALQQEQESYKKRFETLKTNTENETLKKIAIPHKSDFAIVDIENIVTIEADRMYSKLSVLDASAKAIKTYIYAKKLSHFEDLFEQLPHFYRVHRSWIINSRYVDTYSKKDHTLHLTNGTKIPVSKSRRERLEKSLGF